jgi:cellulose synthase operon protein C
MARFARPLALSERNHPIPQAPYQFRFEPAAGRDMIFTSKKRSILSLLVLSAALLILPSCIGLVADRSPQGAEISPDDSELHERVTQIQDYIEEKEFERAVECIDQTLADHPTQPELHLMKAQILSERGQTQAAMDYLTELIIRFPDQPELVEVRGVLLLKLGYQSSARTDFAEAYRRGHRSFTLLSTLAEIERDNGNLQVSLHLIEEALRLRPEAVEHWVLKAQLEARLGQIDKAQQSSWRALQLDSNNIKLHQFYVDILSVRQQHADIISHIKEIYQRFPLDPWVSIQYSTLLYSEQNIAEAQVVLEKALSANPDNHLLMFQLGSVLAGSKDWLASVRYFEAGLAIDQDSTWAKTQLAKVYLQLGQIETATDYLTQARNANSKDMFVYVTLAKLFHHQNDTFEAERIILDGLEIDERNQDLIMEYALILERRANYREAIEAYEEALLNEPDDPVIVGRLGNLYRLIGEYERSQAYFQRAIGLNPSASWIRAYYVELLTDREQWSEAMVAIDQLLEITPDDYWAFAKKALIQIRLERYLSAHVAIRRAIALRPDIPWLIEVEGQVLERLGHYAEAEAAILKALSQSPDRAQLHARLGYIQVHLDPDKALASVTTALNLADFDISTVELYLFLTGEASAIWQFKPDSDEALLYRRIILQEFDAVRALIDQQKERSKQNTVFLEALYHFIRDGAGRFRPIEVEVSTEDFSAWHWFYLALQQAEEGQHQQAQVYFERGLEKDPDNPWMMVKSAYTDQSLRKHESAIDKLERYLQIRPEGKSVWVKLRLALNYDLAGRYDDAERIYQSILSDDPNDDVALNNLAWMYLTMKTDRPRKLDEALDLVLKAVELSPSPANLDTLAEAYYQRSEYQKALKTIERALDQDRNNLDDFKKTKKKILRAIRMESEE